MTLNARIESTLASIGCPVAFQTFPESVFTTFPRISYFCINEQVVYSADDAPAAVEYAVQVDVWHNTDYASLVSQVQAAMSAAGFGRGSGGDIYDPDSRIYHKPLRFYYTEVL